MSIRIKFFIVFLLGSLIPLITVGSLIYLDVKKNTEKSVITHINALADIQKERVNEVIHDYQRNLNIFTARLLLKEQLNFYNLSKDPTAQQKLIQSLLDVQKSVESFKEIHLLDVSGRIVASTIQSKIGQVHATDEFFKKGFNKNDVSLFFKDSQGNVRIYLTGPLILDSKKIGVVVIESDTLALFKIFEGSTGLGKSGDWGLSQRMENGDALLIVPRKVDTNPDSPLTSRISHEQDETPVIQAIRGNEKLFLDTVDYRGVPVISATRYIEDPGLALAVVIDKAEAYAPIQTLETNFIYFILLTLIFLLFLSSFLSQGIISSILDLSKSAQRIKNGDFSLQIHVNSDDEVGQLARAFNEMVEKLHSYYDTLEEKVATRTSELQKFKLAVENVSDHITITDARGVILYANKAVEAITGYSPHEVLGKKAGSDTLWGGVMSEEFYERLWNTISVKQKPFHTEITNKRKDGLLYQADLTIIPVLDENNKTMFYVEVQRDISKQKNLEKNREKQLRSEIEIEKKERDFIAVASHQLLTPLTVIEGYLSIIARSKTSANKPPVVEYVRDSLQSAKRMSELIKKLLTTSRIDQNLLPIRKTNFDLVELIQSVIKDLQQKSKMKNLEISLISQNALNIFSDRDQLRQVLQNLLDNAIKYTERGGVKIFVVDEGKRVRVRIKDTGIGISDHDLPNIFNKFSYSQNWVNKQSESNGLGLYIAKSLIEALGGILSVESDRSGSTFTFTIVQP